ncbi:SDR family NAD(P)-dependent oxidoreductase [Levilactobacillus fujinensis]|uniref:SDR family NAD(P)-dependent oxidoreductase n=1 Tax=Levilactobacillus fujinensis TaxID=2486024 RepID=A0ABW1TET0_9LACO|nr:SDR family NAD(P)-dependent oxidoreductase [Levilactobacillus fujinensis]
MTNQNVILITGASSGMGYAATKLFAERGWQVFAGARRVEKIPQLTNVRALPLDVTDSASNQNFVTTAITEAGRIDVLLNNAGYGEFGPLEEVSMANVRKQLDTNLLGAAELAQFVLPTMRAQGSGRIINNSSIGGDLYSPLGGWYYVAKHALNTWSDVLDTEIRQFGLRSVVVAPGGTESSWGEIALKNVTKNLKADSPYQPMVDGTMQLMDRLTESSSATALDLAKVFYRAATDRLPHRRYYYSVADRMMSHFARVHAGAFHQVMNLAVKHFI